MTPEEMKNHRVKLDLSQVELAKKLEQSRRYIQYREGGVIKIGAMMRYAILYLVSQNKKKR